MSIVHEYGVWSLNQMTYRQHVNPYWWIQLMDFCIEKLSLPDEKKKKKKMSRYEWETSKKRGAHVNYAVDLYASFRLALMYIQRTVVHK